MKRYLILIVVLVVSIGAFANYSFSGGGFGTEAEGFVMGKLSKFETSGLVSKTGEGEILLGTDSTPFNRKYTGVNGEEVVEPVNPWRFSSLDSGLNKKLSSLKNKFVVIQFHQTKIKSDKTKTLFEVVDAFVPADPVNDICVSKTWYEGGYSGGEIFGRLVGAVSKGFVSTSWEVVIQQGTSGNVFVPLSIKEDIALYQCATRFLRSGQLAKITYVDSPLNVKIRTGPMHLEILKIEPAQ